MINKVVPHQGAFNRVRQLGHCNSTVLYTTTLLAIASMVFSGWLKQKGLIDILNMMNAILIFSYFILDMLGSFLLQKAETTRRLGFIDNSFDANLSGDKSEGYFTNDNITPGIYRMAVNCFENVFFSHNISSRMVTGLAVKNLIIAGIFIAAAALGERELVILIFQLSLPVVLLQQLFKLILYIRSTETVLSSFKTLFNDLRGQPPTKHKTAEILRNVIHYETNISWGSITLSSSLFKALNDDLSLKWEDIKMRYGIS